MIWVVFVLDSRLSLFEFLEHKDVYLDSAKNFRNDIHNVYLKRMVTLRELLKYREFSSDIDQEFSLAFTTAICDELNKIKRAVLIVPHSFQNDCDLSEILCESNIVLVADNPRLEFIKLANLIVSHLERDRSSDSGTSNSIVYGKNCVIKDGAVIGKAGFGFERDVDGTPIRFPHFGRVFLGDNVEVGANSVISKGAIEDTLVGDSTKIDDLVYIAHNCRIGKKVMIAGNATLCGGVQVGDSAWIGAGASIKQNIKIGEGAIVGMGAVVTRDVPAYATAAGNPARVIKQTKQTQGAA